MSTVTGSRVVDNSRVMTYTWQNLINGATGSWCDVGPYVGPNGVVSVQFFGTFGTGGNIAWDTSSDGVNFFTVSATNTTANQFTINGVARFIRPRITAGDGTTNLTAYAQVPAHAG